MRAQIIPSVFTAVDKFSSVMDRMSKNTNKSSAVMERNLRKVSAQAMSIGRTAGAIGVGVIAPLGLAVKAASDFETKMSSVSTLVDTNKESMTKMGDEVLAMARKMPVPIEEMTTALYDIRSAGIPAAQAMSTLEYSAKLAKAGLSSTSEATNILTSSINAFKSENLSAAQISDILFKTVKAGKTTMAELAQQFGSSAPIVQSAGVKLADFSAATAALTTLGTPASQAQNQIKASIVALQKPTADMEKIFKKLGVTSAKELIDREGSMVGAFDAVNAAGRGMGVNLAKAWSSVEASAAVTSLLGATNEAYTNTLKDMTTGSNALEDAYRKQAETMAAKSQLLKNNLQAIAITVGNALIPVFNSLVEKMMPIINRTTEWISKNKSTVVWIVKIAAVLGGLALAVSAAAFTVGIISKGILVFNSVMKAWQIITGAVTAFQWALNAAMLANPIGLIIIGVAALIAGIVLLYKNWDAFKNAFTFDNMLAGVRKFGGYVMDFMLAPLRLVLKAASFLPGVGDKAKAALKGLDDIRNKITGEFQGGEAKGGSKKIVDTQKTAVEKTTKNITESNKRMTLDIKGAPQGSMLDGRPIGGTGLNQLATN